MTDLYFPIRLNTLREKAEISFDVFIKVGERFIHYSRQSESIESMRLEGLKSKGVRKLFIRSQDEDSYLSYLEVGLRSLNNKDVDLKERASLAHDTMVTAAENAERSLETEAGYRSQSAQMQSISEFFGTQKDSLKEVLRIAGVSTDINNHSATVANLCLAISKRIDSLSPQDVADLGTAALLHDIGKSRLKFDTMRKDASFSPEEKRQLRQHPQDGADMLAGKSYISPRILGLIASHEERGNGRGYPEKKNIAELQLPYQILSMVNQFDHLCVERNILPLEAMDQFYDAFGNDYSDELITILATVIT
jgi:putative nucleotidyltransferase with HDIG domain